MFLAQGHNTVTPVRLEPAALRSRVKHSTTEPQCSLMIYLICQRKYIMTLVSTKLTTFIPSLSAFAPLLRLSPPPTDRDYYFNLDDNEGACDLFDVPLLSM